jgi:hypothetical protein
MKIRRNELFYEPKIGRMCNVCNVHYRNRKQYNQKTKKWNMISKNKDYVKKPKKPRISLYTTLTKDVRKNLGEKGYTNRRTFSLTDNILDFLD